MIIRGVVFLVGMMCVGVNVGASGQGAGQQTVSLATLRVPEKAAAHLERARQAVIAGREAEYEKELDRALRIDADYAEAYVLRGSHEVMLGKYAAGAEDGLRAKRLDPGSIFAGVVVASAYNGLRRYREAWAELESLRGRDAESWQAQYERARAALGVGNLEDALRWSKAALDAVPVSFVDNARVLRANALQLAKRYADEAVQLQAYLASPRPQPLRGQVQAALDRALNMRDGTEVAGLETH